MFSAAREARTPLASSRWPSVAPFGLTWPIAPVEAKRLKQGRFVLIPTSKDTHGHGTHTWAALWKDELAALLKRSGG